MRGSGRGVERWKGGGGEGAGGAGAGPVMVVIIAVVGSVLWDVYIPLAVRITRVLADSLCHNE